MRNAGAGGDRQDPAPPAGEGSRRAGRAVGDGSAGGADERRGGVRADGGGAARASRAGERR
jgi:hypothetical protein